MATFLAPLLRRTDDVYQLVNVRNGAVVGEQLLTAFDSASRRQGLLGRDALARGTLLIIAPSNAVHTFFMRFPIDIAFVAKDGHILKLRHAVPARRMAAALRAHAVIEMPAGTLERTGTQPGDRLQIAKRDIS
jgi:uncharacterized membrane protein (UPF0127 family)